MPRKKSHKARGKSATREGPRRAPGIVLLSVPLHKTLKEKITQIAASQGLGAASWVRLRLREAVERRFDTAAPVIYVPPIVERIGNGIYFPR
jgi:hypothetical protein